MRITSRNAGGVVMGLCLMACSSSQPTSAELVQPCKDPRPQMCTMDYRPVCAFRGEQERREYSNGCSACADPEVSGYVEGKCAADESQR